MSDELTSLVAKLSPLDPRSSAGVDAIFTLAKALASEPEFDQPRAVTTGRGCTGFSTDSVAQRILGMARESGDAVAAIGWMRKVATSKLASGGAVKALYGVTCSAPIWMSDNIMLLPFANLPQSATRDWILEEHDQANARPGFHGFTPPPSAALYRPGTIDPLFIDTTAFPSTSPTTAWFEDLDDAALVLALIPRAIPTEAAHWLHADDIDIARLVQFGVSRLTFGDMPPPPLSAPIDVQAGSTTGLVDGFQKLSKKDKDRVTLALRRLLRGRCHLNPGNRAIDLAIALEVLFMNVDRDEHSFKISLRAARLLRESIGARRTAFAEVKAVYSLRSLMVHTGSGQDEWSIDGAKRSAFDVVEAGDVLCAQAVRSFLSMGHIPDNWREVELR
jgi:hypothetical protein